MRDIQQMGEKAKVDLSNVLAKQDYVATAVDGWYSPGANEVSWQHCRSTAYISY